MNVASPLVMGILNVTPDSFSDGGDHFAREAAIERALAMVEEGADIIDVGPESSRPGSESVPATEQIARAIPVIEAIRRHNAAVTTSIDTRLASVARAAFAAGAAMLNDISALRDDPAMAEVVAAQEVSVVLMHMKGTPADMQRGGGPHYEDAIAEVCDFLCARRELAISRGVERSRIVFDPGLGFGKRVEHNLEIMRNLDRFTALGQPVLIGASRKSFIGHVLGIEDPRQRRAGSIACAVLAAVAGVAIVRVHDVRATVEAVRLCAAITSNGKRV